MAECFAVPTKCDSEKRTKLLSHLKCLMTSLEDELTPKAEPVCYTPVCLTTCIPCCPPPCKPPTATTPDILVIFDDSPCLTTCIPCCPQPCKPPTATTPDILVCYKCKTDSSKKKKNKANVGKELGESKSRELRAGILYVGCDCERKNGLQDNCLRTGCQGSPECLKSPPTCLPSKYCNGKHLMKKLRNKYAKNESEGSGEEEEGPDSISYQCFEAAVKVPDQKICVLMPSLGCPPDCKQDKKAC